MSRYVTIGLNGIRYEYCLPEMVGYIMDEDEVDPALVEDVRVYFKQFLPPPPLRDWTGDFIEDLKQYPCVRCEKPQVGAFSMFKWTDVLGEGCGICLNCGWPSKQKHLIFDDNNILITQFGPCLLQYHPEYVLAINGEM